MIFPDLNQVLFFIMCMYIALNFIVAFTFRFLLSGIMTLLLAIAVGAYTGNFASTEFSMILGFAIIKIIVGIFSALDEGRINAHRY